MIRKIDLYNEIYPLLELQKKSYAVEAQLINFPNLPPLKDNVLTLQNSGETFIGYFLNDELAGVISYENNQNILDICRLFVDPVHFRKGIAGALLNYIVKTAPFEKAVVATGSANIPAIHLYKKLGFIIKEQMFIENGLSIVKLELKN
ncbi:GNAT family N-acetyltransferase [Metabacillus fastidiosus]|uniref:GNAT family N-acetyltransferase n=1 Tax=Metabacillus fastidiosus TaxID=1458 RepID=UPI002E1D45E4|nr:GNAT family N-acetyltransferase [Metabacillus fastidiosus]MED4532742.1 GNAT family N-acetyltransferase [Metabacillus fastidiosus]